MVEELNLIKIKRILQKNLSQNQAKIINMSFGLDNNIQMTNEEISQNTGFSLKRIESFKYEALKNLKQIPYFQQMIENKIKKETERNELK